MEVFHIGESEESKLEVSAKMYNSRYTNSHLDAADNEKQKLRMISIIISEKQVPI